MTYDEIGNRIQELRKAKMLLENMANTIEEGDKKNALLEGVKYISIRLSEYKKASWVMLD